MSETYDIAIVGGGVTGTALLYALTRYSNVGYEPKKTQEIDLSATKKGEAVLDIDIPMKGKESQ